MSVLCVRTSQHTLNQGDVSQVCMNEVRVDHEQGVAHNAGTSGCKTNSCGLLCLKVVLATPMGWKISQQSTKNNKSACMPCSWRARASPPRVCCAAIGNTHNSNPQLLLPCLVTDHCGPIDKHSLTGQPRKQRQHWPKAYTWPDEPIEVVHSF